MENLQEGYTTYGPINMFSLQTTKSYSTGRILTAVKK